EAFVSWLPHQPYNSTPRMTPGQKILMRLVGAGQGQHPFHFHGNNADLIARDGRLLAHPVSKFTTLSVPGETVDQIFTWTGAKLGWDIYGTPADGMQAHACIDSDGDGFGDSAAGSTYEHEYCADHYQSCTDANADGRDDVTGARCKNGYTKAFPVVLPEKQNLAFGGWWSGSPFMGGSEPLPPGEGGLNPNGGYFFMWHSHAEKELTNFDIFPGGMMSMMVVEPPGTPIP
ncbi:MAG TPA: multicopper oxidase domain-containing protein, partial [Bacteroidota bacterium]|nr:multicopper oxidase domain-containing protein [Bacteroidota bacterium]